MLTIAMLKAMPPCTIFATGKLFDASDGLFMANTGRMLRWVAIRGEIPDWAIYCHFAFDKSTSWIAQNGDKVIYKVHIRKCVLCDDEALNWYRF